MSGTDGVGTKLKVLFKNMQVLGIILEQFYSGIRFIDIRTLLATGSLKMGLSSESRNLYQRFNGHFNFFVLCIFIFVLCHYLIISRLHRRVANTAVWVRTW